MDPITGLIIGGATLLGGAISSAGQASANEANIDNNNFWNRVSISLANSAHQREVADLQKAGLNPVLSASSSGAAVPALASSNVINSLSSLGNGISDGVNSAARLMAYEAPQAKADLKTTELNNEYQDLINSAAREEKEADSIRARNDQLLAELENDAINKQLGISHSVDRHGNVSTNFDKKRYDDAVELAREGVQSDLKLRSNANWRANWSSFLPFMSPISSQGSSGLGVMSNRLGHRWSAKIFK